MVGPVQAGQYKFVFEGNAPDPSKLPASDILGITIVMITCSYKVECGCNRCAVVGLGNWQSRFCGQHTRWNEIPRFVDHE
jgi:hypothetical protein